MQKYLTITIDVEPDCSPDWRYSDPLSFQGVSRGIGEILQPLFNKYGITPTYLINNVVLEDDASVRSFKQLTGNFELGTHLHPEFIQPEKKYDQYAGKKGEANCCFLDPDIEFEKIKNITFLFERAFGYRPTSFRAGRYSAGLNTMRSLRELSYLVDSSVTPHMIWNDRSRESPVDFRLAPEQPYFLHPDSMIREDPGSKLLEVPISISSRKRNLIRELAVSLAGFRHPMRREKTYWLRPYYSTTSQLTQIAREFTSSNQGRNISVANMMFHNVEVLAGLSPYSLTDTDCEMYIRQLEDFFAFCQTENIKSLSLTELYGVFKK